jgi:trans-2,3-dihydro-3-hydroxyanthranilate isomerase
MPGNLNDTRRKFLKTLAASTIAPTLFDHARASTTAASNESVRHFHYMQIDVFTSQRLQGNQLSVFTDARGLSDSEMQELARETNLNETTFVLPRDAAVEAHEGVKVRIFTPEQEIPFGGHPALGTAMVLRTLRMGQNAGKTSVSQIVLDLKVGKVPVSFREESDGVFGEMQQVPPVFGTLHDRGKVAEVLGFDPSEIEPDLPIQTVSTGLPFAIVPIRRLSTLQSLHLDSQKVNNYLRAQGTERLGFYFVTRDTGDSKVKLRSRGIFPPIEDPATGAAAGCASAWMVKYGVARPDETELILQGVEMKRPSRLFVRSGKGGTNIANVRVGGYAVQVLEGKASL